MRAEIDIVRCCALRVTYICVRVELAVGVERYLSRDHDDRLTGRQRLGVKVAVDEPPLVEVDLAMKSAEVSSSAVEFHPPCIEHYERCLRGVGVWVRCDASNSGGAARLE